MHIWAHIIFYLSIIVILMLFAMLFVPEGRQRISQKTGRWILVIIVWMVIGGMAHEDIEKGNAEQQHQEQVQEHPNLIGHKINKHLAKKDDSGFYYVDKDDSKLRYFVTDGKITAVKYDYRPNYQVGTDVQNKLETILHDSHIKYGNDKFSRSETLLKGDAYNIYSPKYKKWYNVSIQRQAKDHITMFTVYPDKSSNPDAD